MFSTLEKCRYLYCYLVSYREFEIFVSDSSFARVPCIFDGPLAGSKGLESDGGEEDEETATI